MPRTARVAGIVTTAELTAAGFSGTRIRTLTRRGDLYQVGRGVYANGPRARETLAFPDGLQLLQPGSGSRGHRAWRRGQP